MKNFVFAVICVLVCPILNSTTEASVSIQELPFECLDMDQLAATGQYAPYRDALREVSKTISKDHPDLAASVGFGKCLNLAETSVLAIAQNQLLNLPSECVGLTFLGLDKRDVVEKAKLTILVQDGVIDGQSGSAAIEVNGQSINVPICMESFEGGGPQ